MEKNKIKVVFKFDKEKDLLNHWYKSNWKPPFGDFKISPKIKEICEGKEFEECKDELSDYISKNYNSKTIRMQLESVEKAWKKIEEEFFRRMDDVMKRKFNKEIIAYLTTLNICPYDPTEPSFMFSVTYSLPNALKTCGHEIMHLYFHKFYWHYVEKELGEKKTGDLKEAVTVLLNLEFKDLWSVDDKGYDEHQELRKFISDEWKKEKDFEKVIDRCVQYLKKSN